MSVGAYLSSRAVARQVLSTQVSLTYIISTFGVAVVTVYSQQLYRRSIQHNDTINECYLSYTDFLAYDLIISFNNEIVQNRLLSRPQLRGFDNSAENSIFSHNTTCNSSTAEGF